MKMFLSDDAVLNEITALEVDTPGKAMVFVPGRTHHSLSWRKTGRVTLISEGEQFVSEPGCLLFVPRGLSYSTQALEDTTMNVVHFTLLRGSFSKRPMVIHAETNPLYPVLFGEMLRVYKEEKENPFAVQSAFYRILAQVRDTLLLPVRSYIPGWLNSAREKIENGFAEELSVSDLASQAGVSDVYFRKEFKEYFGMPPSVYIQKVRMEQAKILLRSGYYSIGEVAIRCGYESISYFSCEFRRINGMTPSAYITIYENQK